MRVGKAVSGTGTCWGMASFTLGKIGTMLPLEVARPFWCTLLVGMLMEN